MAPENAPTRNATNKPPGQASEPGDWLAMATERKAGAAMPPPPDHNAVAARVAEIVSPTPNTPKAVPEETALDEEEAPDAPAEA